jgi:hypothetical protein
MEIKLGSFSRVGVSAQPCLSPNHNLCNSGSLVARLLEAVHGVSLKMWLIFQLSDGVSQPKMFVGALYFLDSFMSMQSLTDSDKKNILMQQYTHADKTHCTCNALLNMAISFNLSKHTSHRMPSSGSPCDGTGCTHFQCSCRG